ncbi:hypothetical protein [Acetobacter fallax]|uniref:Lipoprotein n=1 Tax=Acetobacter fallax TaxID=1737473 RepID=A0ABX0KKM5_9PROT|nr:hypothetical protein [Acetobacter fallax]NHO34427.1 hypothetical protein [Acetobacter fallax]NHO37985.1 hypothetical protein [Acetobacter fallax]
MIARHFTAAMRFPTGRPAGAASWLNPAAITCMSIHRGNAHAVADPSHNRGCGRAIEEEPAVMKLTIIGIASLCMLTGCSHPRPMDDRAALLRSPLNRTNVPQDDSTPPDGRMHGQMSVGTGFGAERGYGAGAGASPMGASPGGW